MNVVGIKWLDNPTKCEKYVYETIFFALMDKLLQRKHYSCDIVNIVSYLGYCTPLQNIYVLLVNRLLNAHMAMWVIWVNESFDSTETC